MDKEDGVGQKEGGTSTRPLRGEDIIPPLIDPVFLAPPNSFHSDLPPIVTLVFCSGYIEKIISKKQVNTYP